nr:hypothetical protein [Clostridium sp. Marseille-P7770]
MEIVNNYGGRRKLIKDVPVGQCFMYDNRLCMKLKSDTPDEYFNNRFVDFEKNKINGIPDSAEVLVIDAKIIVE